MEYRLKYYYFLFIFKIDFNIFGGRSVNTKKTEKFKYNSTIIFRRKKTLTTQTITYDFFVVVFYVVW